MIFPSYFSVLCAVLYAELWAFIPDSFLPLCCYVNFTFLFTFVITKLLNSLFTHLVLQEWAFPWFKLVFWNSYQRVQIGVSVSLTISLRIKKSVILSFGFEPPHLVFYKRGGRWKMSVEEKISLILPVFGVTAASINLFTVVIFVWTVKS